jgi:tetratricopeptide (TPR) repeat protein
MSKLIILILLFIAPINDFNKIARINSLKKEAANAFKSENFDRAISIYKTLIEDFNVNEESLILNYGNALYKTGETELAISQYKKVASSKNHNLKSAALTQSGVIAYQKKQNQEAMDFFKKALKVNPSNAEARYNYELLKKQMKREEEKKENEKNMEPSEFAKALKKRADALVDQRKYGEAFNLMRDGMQKDETVGVYQSFIQRLNVITEID